MLMPFVYCNISRVETIKILSLAKGCTNTEKEKVFVRGDAVF